MPRLAGTLVALALAAALAGCGGGSTPELSGVAQAAEKTQSAGTARFELSFEAKGITGQAGSGTFTAEGAVDYANRRSRMTMDFGELGGLFGQTGQDAGDTSLDMVFDGKVVYMRFPLLSGLLGQGKPWLKMDLEKLAGQAGVDLGQLGQLDQADPTQALAYLRAAGDFDEVGKEVVRGVETIHYTGTIDLRNAVDQLSGAQREQLEKLLDQGGVSKLPADAWIDGDGYLRKLTLKFAEVPGAPDAALTMAMELYDFGADVNLDIPSNDEVTDITELAGKGGLGG